MKYHLYLLYLLSARNLSNESGMFCPDSFFFVFGCGSWLGDCVKKQTNSCVWRLDRVITLC